MNGLLEKRIDLMDEPQPVPAPPPPPAEGGKDDNVAGVPKTPQKWPTIIQVIVGLVAIVGAVAVALGFVNTSIGNSEAAIKKELGGLKTDFTQQIKDAEKRLNKRIDGVEKSLGTKIDNAEARLNKRIDGVETKLNAHIKAVEKRFRDLEWKLDEHIRKTNERFVKLEFSIKLIGRDIERLRDELKALRRDVRRNHVALLKIDKRILAVIIRLQKQFKVPSENNEAEDLKKEVEEEIKALRKEVGRSYKPESADYLNYYGTILSLKADKLVMNFSDEKAITFTLSKDSKVYYFDGSDKWEPFGKDAIKPQLDAIVYYIELASTKEKRARAVLVFPN